MHEVIIFRIQEYMKECLFEPKKNWPEYELRTRIYSRWAVSEVLLRITEETLRLPSNISGREKKSPNDIINTFIEEMDYFYELTSANESRFIFATAREASKELLCLL